jgi:hypothetical protein
LGIFRKKSGVLEIFKIMRSFGNFEILSRFRNKTNFQEFSGFLGCLKILGVVEITRI